MAKQDGAFLTIGELAAELGVPHHILRYWESRFPALRPLQRAGNRRYYRPDDVKLARTIHRLLTVERYTIEGAQIALSGKASAAAQAGESEQPSGAPVEAAASSALEGEAVIQKLKALQDKLKQALRPEE